MMVDQVEEAGSRGRAGYCSALQTKTNPIIEDYNISSNVLGLGINGKVVECFSKKDNTKYALKVSVLPSSLGPGRQASLGGLTK